jgi:hypothetical protein
MYTFTSAKILKVMAHKLTVLVPQQKRKQLEHTTHSQYGYQGGQVVM